MHEKFRKTNLHMLLIFESGTTFTRKKTMFSKNDGINSQFIYSNLSMEIDFFFFVSPRLEIHISSILVITNNFFALTCLTS